MKAWALTSFLVSCATAANADPYELSQSELRNAVSQSRAIPTRDLIAGVEDFTGGQVLDIRAFACDGSLTYRILYQQHGGALGSILIDGGSGQEVNPASSRAKEISAFASTTAGTGLRFTD